MGKNVELERKDSSPTINFSHSFVGNSFLSSLTGDIDSKQPSSSFAFQMTNFSQVSTIGKLPLSSSSSFKRKCSSETLGSAKCGSSSSKCRCSKKKVNRVVRVPAISLKMADIPPDDYSWRKYGQKPIQGSPHPRGYYKCNSVRGCPARKHVERAVDDPLMLIVTYEGEHNHSLSIAEASAPAGSDRPPRRQRLLRRSTCLAASHLSPLITSLVSNLVDSSDLNYRSRFLLNHPSDSIGLSGLRFPS